MGSGDEIVFTGVVGNSEVLDEANVRLLLFAAPASFWFWGAVSCSHADGPVGIDGTLTMSLDVLAVSFMLDDHK